MKNGFFIFFCFLLSVFPSCKKEPLKTIYTEAQPIIGDFNYDNCGFLLEINNQTYAPTNLPQKYQQYSGISGEHLVYIQYNLLSDSLHCFDSLGKRRVERVYQYLEITKILE